MDIYLSVVIPAYNEEKRIGKTLRAVHDFLSRQSYTYEILVVCDGARDNTAAVVQGLVGEIANLHLINNQENHGKGYVVRQGMLESEGQVRLFMDADNSTSVDQFEKMAPFFQQGYDVVIGSRDIKGAEIQIHQAWYKELLGNLGNIFIQVVAGLWGVWDTQCGFKAFSVQSTEVIFPKLTINRWGFDIEALAAAKKNKFKIKQIPVVWVNDAASHVKMSAYIEVLWETIKIRWNLLKGLYK